METAQLALNNPCYPIHHAGLRETIGLKRREVLDECDCKAQTVSPKSETDQR